MYPCIKKHLRYVFGSAAAGAVVGAAAGAFISHDSGGAVVGAALGSHAVAIVVGSVRNVLGLD